jgi:hypothetical protein
MKKTTLTHPPQIAAIVGRGMLWFHLPIVDISIPDEGFERQWAVAGDELRRLLPGGRHVLVHCRGPRASLARPLAAATLVYVDQ